MRILKRLTAYCLTAAMVLGLVPGSAFAAGDGAASSGPTYYVADSAGGGSNVDGDGTRTKPYLSISHAIEAASAAGETSLTIEMLTDIGITKTLSFADAKVRNITVNGNNKDIIYQGNWDLGTGTAAITVENGSSVKFSNMGLTRQEGLTYFGGILFVANASVTLDKVNVTNGDLSVTDYDDGGSAIHVAAGGKVDVENDSKITGNTTRGTNTSGALYVADGGTLNLYGAIVESNAAAARGTGIYVQNGGNLNLYSSGSLVQVKDEIYVEVGANATVGAVEGQSGNIRLGRVFLESDPTAEGKVATLDIAGDTSDASIGIEVINENYHQVYRLISAEANAYTIHTATGDKDETGWTDNDGQRDIRYMVYDGVPGLYFYYFTLDATFHDVDTLTGINGKDINGADVSYYNPQEVLNTTKSGGVLTIPEIIPANGGDYIVTFTVDEANKDYRIPTPDVIKLTLDGIILTSGTDYEYTPNYENGTATIRIFDSFLQGKSGTLDFLISGEKYSLLTLQMNGPVYTMTTDITGQSVTHALSVVETVSADATQISYEITRTDATGYNVPVPEVTVVLYSEGTGDMLQTGVTDAAGKVSFTGLDNAKSCYYVLYYSDSFYVIARDKVEVAMSTLEGQKMAPRCEFDSSAVQVRYTVTDAENYGAAQSSITGTVKDTTVTHYIDLAQDTILFKANQGEATTADTATFSFRGASYRVDEFSKEMETNASTYGELPGISMVGYIFDGWFDKIADHVSVGNLIQNTTPYDTVSSPKTLYAHWTPRTDIQYKVQHWVELTENGINPGYVAGTTQMKEVDGIVYYLWTTDTFQDGTADSFLDISPLALTKARMTDPAHSWWTLDGFTIVPEQNCFVLANGSSIFGIYYNRNEYTLTYDPTEGRMTTGLNTQTCKFGVDVGPMLVAIRDGYTFGGWYYDIGGGDEAVVTSTSWYTWTGPITVSARWIASNTTYTIIVMTEDKSYDPDGLAYADGTYTQFKSVAKNNEGLSLPAVSDTYMEVEVASLNALKFDGFTYIGYSDTKDEQAAGMTADSSKFALTPNEHGTSVVYLYYSRNEVEVTFLDDDGADAAPFDTVTITYGDTFEHALPDGTPTKPGYDFVKWVDEHSNTISSETDTNDYTAAGDGSMSVRPVWNARSYYLTYVPGEETNFDVSALGVGYTINSSVKGGYTVAKTVTYDQPVGTMPTASKVGHEFLGWMLQDGASAGQYVTAETPADISNVVIQNAENSMEETRPLYAQYAPYEYTLVLDPGAGTCSPTSLTVTYGAPTPELPTPALTGYTFTGWMLDTENAGQTRIESGETWSYLTTNGAEITAHAMYHPNRYTYTLDLNDAEKGNGSTTAALYDTTVSSVEIQFGSEYAQVLNNLVAYRNGYDFLGWSTTTDKADLLTADAVNTLPENSTVHAIWQPQVFSLHIDLRGGDLSSENAYSWNRYAEQYYEDYERTYGVAEMNAVQTGTYTWEVPIIFDTVYGALDQLSKEHYKFEGYLVGAPRWYNGDNKVLDGQIINALDIGYTDCVDKYVTLDAVWTPYFDFVIEQADAHFADGSTGTKTILRTDLTEMPEAVREGYTFLGWYDDVAAKYADLAYVLTLDEYRSFRAIFTPNVTFNGNGGKVIVDGVAYDSYTIGLHTLVEKYGEFFSAKKDGTTFMGWKAEDATDLTKFENIKNRVEPMTLIAQYAVTVTFRIPSTATWPDGTGGNRTYTTFEVGEWSELPTVSLPGYEFLGWYDVSTEEDITTAPVLPAQLSARTESSSVYAIFRAGSGYDPAKGINVKVTNYGASTDGSAANASYAIPDGGWVAGKNVFSVTSKYACGVALHRDGAYTELAYSHVNGDTHYFTETLQENDEIIIVIKGDVDLNGRVNATDVTRLNQYLVSLYPFEYPNTLAADADLNGRVNATDSTRISQHLVSLYAFQWRTKDTLSESGLNLVP